MSEFEKIDSVTSSERLDVIFTIVPKGKGESVTDVLRKNDVLECLIFHGHGTAPSNILKMLGLGATDKEIVLGFTQDEKSHDIIKAIDKKLNFEKPGNGITFVVPLQSVAGIMAFKFLTTNYSEDM